MNDQQLKICPSDLGCPNYVNRNCYTARMLNAPPTKRCQYCNLKFRHCLFFQYSVITLGLVVFLLVISYLLDGEITRSVTITIFVLVIIYGFFFNKSTGKIIEANFSEKKAKEALEELAGKLEEKVKAQTHNLEEKNQNLVKLLIMRSEFLDLASHQLRTPVSVIKNIIEMMDEGDFDKLSKEERKRHIHNAFEKSIKLEQIINDILVTSELDTVGFKVDASNAQEIRLEDLVDKAVADINFEAEQRKIALDWKRPKAPLPPIIGNDHYLYHAVFNLIDNAVKYTPSLGQTKESRGKRSLAGQVKIGLEMQGEELVFSVQDNGIGIPRGEVTDMFKKFSRASNARDMYTDGSGLGLFIVKEIVEGHGGRVGVESELGKGSTFRIFLPIRK
jgi:signal transduction histidine kinase